MALDKAELKSRIIAAMEAQGATASGPHSWVSKMADAISSAVIDEIQSNAEVPVTGGSSAGTYGVK